LGVILFRQGDTAAARELLKRATDSPRASAEMYNNFGALLNARGEFDLAAEAFKRAIALKPGLPVGIQQSGRDLSRPQAPGLGH